MFCTAGSTYNISLVDTTKGIFCLDSLKNIDSFDVASHIGGKELVNMVILRCIWLLSSIFFVFFLSMYFPLVLLLESCFDVDS
jgi:hypothetical protein